MAPRDGGALGVVTSAKPHHDTFWTIWTNDPEWSHPEPQAALRPADIPPPARFLGQMLKDLRVIASNPDVFPKQQPLIKALRQGIQWYEHGPIPPGAACRGTYGR